MALQPLYDNVPDEKLGALLYNLFYVEGHTSIDIKHPSGETKTVTKDDYKEILAGIMKYKKMSPAKRLIEKKRIQNAQEIKHRTAMLTAKSYVVDIDDEENFGSDIDGNEIDMVEMAFVPVIKYLKGVQLLDNEIGSFVHPESKKPPSRIISRG